jgi:hypothetical protein
VVLVSSLVAALALYLSGTPLLSLVSSQSESSSEGSITASQYQIHWSLLAVCAAGVAGLVVLAWPQRQPPKLQL